MCDRITWSSGRVTGRHNGVDVLLGGPIRSLQLGIGHGGMMIACGLAAVVVVRVVRRVRRGYCVLMTMI